MELEGTETQIIETRFLPEDVLVQILCRLPDKPLVRFKSVSKPWYSLISQICFQYPRPAVVGLFLRTFQLLYKDPQFNLPYIIRANRHPLFTHFFSDHLPEKWGRRERMRGHYAYLREEEEVSSIMGDEKARLFGWEESLGSFTLPFKPDPDDLIASCNGLLLFVDIDSSLYYVSNPLTRQCVPIPQPPHTQECTEVPLLYAALAFDPSQSSCYKVVRFAWRTSAPDMVLDVYSSADKSWSSHSLQLDPRVSSRNMLRPATYFDGALLRLSLTWHVVQFDFQEQVSMIATRLPLSYEQCNGLMGSMGVLTGSLCYANEYCDMIHIWSLEKYSGDVERIWNLRYEINIHDLTCGLVLNRVYGHPRSKWVGPIAFHPRANVVYLGSPIVILSYNLENNKLDELIRIGKDAFLPGCYCAALTYVRFLAPFNEAGDICAPNL